jgi:two-component system sensor histidine kinase/response regulator
MRSLERLGCLALSEGEWQTARHKLRLLLQALQVPDAALDRLLTGLSSLLRRLAAQQVTQLDVGLRGQTLWLQAAGAFEAPALGGLLQPVRSADGWRFEAQLEGAIPVDHAPLQAILARRSRGQLIRELQTHQASLEREIERRTHALSVSEQRSRTVIDGAPLAVVLIDQQGRVRAWNAVAEQTFGYTEAEALGRPLQALIRLEGDPALPDLLRQGLDAQARQRTHGRFWDLTALREDGSRIAVEAGMTVFAIGEDWHGTLFARDSSERKRAEAALQTAKEAAESAARMKSDFLANMSHEIRTPMNAILGLSHLALKAELAPRLRDQVQKIQQSGQHLLALINDILDFSKVEADKLVVEAVDFQLEEVLSNVATLLGDKAASKGLELVFDVGRDVPTALIGDPLRLGQVLLNYTSNAIKFTERGGIEVVVRVRQRGAAGVLLHFAVRDSGIGLSETQAAQLFQSFQQADSSTTRKYGGTGLGLAISKKLAVLMGGEVGVTSQLGHGSTFWFTAQLGVGQARPRLASGAAAARLPGLRVLVVDDHDSARTVLRGLLEDMGCSVDDVASGPEALERLQQAADGERPYALVFLDWQMPGWDGLETAARLRSAAALGAARMVMVTAFGREELRAQAVGCGIAEVLVKPVGSTALRDCVLGLLAGADTAQPHASVPAPPPQALTGDRIAGLRGVRVLLVEDNALNQEVAVGLLEHLGVCVDVAGDGAVALDMVQRQRYDLVLMDMQMPVMDGESATRAIRALPDFDAPPIVAMTANAMQSDRLRCEAAGMVDFVSKPVEPDALLHTLARWIPPRAEAAAEPAVMPAAVLESTPAEADPADWAALQIPGLNVAAGLRRTLGKTALYHKLLRQFAAGQQAVPAQIRAALAAADAALAQRLAHTLKGVAGNIGAEALQEAAGALEHGLRATPTLAGVDALLQAVEQPLAVLLQALAPLLQPEPPLVAAAPEGPADAAATAALCAELRALLASDDAAALEVLAQQRASLQQVLGARFEVLAQAVAAFDFGAALAVLDATASD